MSTIKTGDTVRHRPTGEDWIVAFVDHERGRLYWLGWPAGSARLGDCELVESCSDEESRYWIECMANMSAHDERRAWALNAQRTLEAD